MLEILVEWLPALLVPPLVALEWRRDPGPARYRRVALALSPIAFVAALVCARVWGALLPAAHLVDGAALGTALGALIGIFVYELMHYGYHRAAHRFDWLFRLTHQMHHSAERLDVHGAYLMHPLDAALFTTLAAIAFGPVCGLSPAQAAIASTFLTLNSVFQHLRIRTPRWLGYLVQRPESHAVHHARGVHAFNYSDLPFWDILFGTFRNPPPGEMPVAGFYDGASSRVGEMLIGVDISRPVTSGTTDTATRGDCAASSAPR